MKSLLFPILSIIAAVGLYFFFISPQLEEVDVLLEKDEEFSQSLNDVREIETIIGRLGSTYASISREDLERLERFLPREFDQVRTSRDLHVILDRENVEISEVTIGDAPRSGRTAEEGEPILNEHIARLVFYADYENFKDILSDIERNIQIAKVNQIGFEYPVGESEDSLGLGLNTYEVELMYYSYDVEEE